MSRRKHKKSLKKIIIGLIIIGIMIAFEYHDFDIQAYINDLFALNSEALETTASFDLNNIPAYTNKPYVTINKNKPGFTEEDYTTKAFEKYS